MKIRSLLVCFLLLPALLFAQASSESAMDNSDYYTATDANNRTLKLAQKPSHILIAGKAGNMPANALFLFEEVESMDLTLPKTDQGLGDFFAFIRPELDQKPRISQTASAEEIASKNSDLVLMKATHYESTAKKLDQLGIPNYTMNLESYEDWKNELRELGKLLKNTARAEQLINLYETQVRFITDRVKGLKEEEKVRILLLQAERSDATYAYKIAPDSWMQTWMGETVVHFLSSRCQQGQANGWSCRSALEQLLLEPRGWSLSSATRCQLQVREGCAGIRGLGQSGRSEKRPGKSKSSRYDELHPACRFLDIGSAVVGKGGISCFVCRLGYGSTSKALLSGFLQHNRRGEA
jgi:ABC-type Fe3+-hydroxamate transport system substrate-binding protein